MKVRPVAIRTGMSVLLLVISPHHPRLVRALFIAHMSTSQTLVHSQDGGRGDRATRDRSATRTSNGLIACRHRLPFLKVAAAIARVRVERHFLTPVQATVNAIASEAPMT
jgi:hypothetical protein